MAALHLTMATLVQNIQIGGHPQYCYFKAILKGRLRTSSGFKDYPLVDEQFAIENAPFIVELPMKHGDFPWLP